MADLRKASNVVHDEHILYDVTGFAQKWHSIPVATSCVRRCCFFQCDVVYSPCPKFRCKFGSTHPLPVHRVLNFVVLEVFGCGTDASFCAVLTRLLVLVYCFLEVLLVLLY